MAPRRGAFRISGPLGQLAEALIREPEAFAVTGRTTGSGWGRVLGLEVQLDHEGGILDRPFGQSGGARKVYWVLQDGDKEEILAVDRFNHTFDAGRVAEDKKVALQFKALFASGVKTRTIPVTIRETVPGSRVHAQGTQKMEWQG